MIIKTSNDETNIKPYQYICALFCEIFVVLRCCSSGFISDIGRHTVVGQVVREPEHGRPVPVVQTVLRAVVPPQHGQVHRVVEGDGRAGGLPM